MQSAGNTSGLAKRLRCWWSAHGKTVLRLVIVLMALLAVARFTIELWPLLLALTVLPLLAPVTMARMRLPWCLVHQVFQPLVWLATMVFLAREARSSRGEMGGAQATAAS